MSEELETGRQSIFDALAAITAITDAIGGATNPRIYQDIAEQGSDFPLVLIRTLPASDDSQSASGDCIFANANFRVVAVNNTRSFASISEVAASIFTTLHLKHFPNVNGGRVLYGRRIRPYSRSYEIDGIHYVESGGDYQLQIR